MSNLCILLAVLAIIALLSLPVIQQKYQAWREARRQHIFIRELIGILAELNARMLVAELDMLMEALEHRKRK